MKKCKGTFTVSAGPPTASRTCLSLFGRQISSMVYFLSENVEMLTDDVSEEDFDKWIRQRPWRYN